jgi:hypothetical protein
MTKRYRQCILPEIMNFIAKRSEFGHQAFFHKLGLGKWKLNNEGQPVL